MSNREYTVFTHTSNTAQGWGRHSQLFCFLGLIHIPAETTSFSIPNHFRVSIFGFWWLLEQNIRKLKRAFSLFFDLSMMNQRDNWWWKWVLVAALTHSVYRPASLWGFRIIYTPVLRFGRTSAEAGRHFMFLSLTSHFTLKLVQLYLINEDWLLELLVAAALLLKMLHVARRSSYTCESCRAVASSAERLQMRRRHDAKLNVSKIS